METGAFCDTSYARLPRYLVLLATADKRLRMPQTATSGAHGSTGEQVRFAETKKELLSLIRAKESF